MLFRSMRVPGIDPRPIQKLTGEYGFTETFFTDARIPASCLIGGEGNGWKVAVQTLQYERGAAAGAAGGLMFVHTSVSDLVTSLRGLKRDGRPLLEDPLVRDEIVGLLVREKSIALGDRRARHRALNTDYPFSLAMSRKLRQTEHSREMRRVGVRLQGAHGSLYVGDDEAIDGGFWQRTYLNSFSSTIGGGTNQVQANIVAERVLGLPKD